MASRYVDEVVEYLDDEFGKGYEGYTTPGWYFLDDWFDAYGPHLSREEAEACGVEHKKRLETMKNDRRNAERNRVSG